MMSFKIKMFAVFCFLFSVSCFSQETAETFFELIKNKKVSEAYNLLEKQKEEGFTEKNFLLTWEKIRLSLGQLENYEKICNEESELGLVSYYKINFEKGDVVFRMHFNKDAISGFFLVQTVPCDSKYSIPSYVDADSFIEEHILVEDQFEITLTRSKNANASNIICILLSGSGKQDKDATIGSNKPLKDLALGLAAKGVSSIRFDKKPLDQISNYTVRDEYTGDVIKIVDYLKKSKEYCDFKIFVVGHSLGGMLAPTIASMEKKIKGAVLIGANFRPIEDLIMEQTEYLLSIDEKTPEENKKQYIDLLKSKIGYLKDSMGIDSDKRKLPFNIPASYWMSLEEYNLNNPKNRKKIKKPMLVLWGEKDYQVRETDFNLYKKYFTKKKNEFKSYKNLNHILMLSNGTMGPSEYSSTQRNIPEYVVDDLVGWLIGI